MHGARSMAHLGGLHVLLWWHPGWSIHACDGLVKIHDRSMGVLACMFIRNVACYTRSAKCMIACSDAPPARLRLQHWDYFFDKVNAVNGGNRYATVLMYLAAADEGGETVRPAASVSLLPRACEATAP